MLVIGRVTDQAVVLNPGTPGQIRILVVDVDGDRRRRGRKTKPVRVGIDAPAEVTILREELIPPAPRTEAGGEGGE